jgi:phosphate-selective porin OprO/OprP
MAHRLLQRCYIFTAILGILYTQGTALFAVQQPFAPHPEQPTTVQSPTTQAIVNEWVAQPNDHTHQPVPQVPVLPQPMLANGELVYSVGQPAFETSQPTPEVQALLERIQALEQAEQKRAEADKAKREAEEAKKKADAEKKLDTGWVDVSDDKWNVKLGGHIQMDYINWAQADPAIPNTFDYFEFRRLRIVADGTGYGLYDFRLQMTLEPESIGESAAGIVTSPEVKDAYFSANEIPILGRWRIGNFFVPFGLEQVTNDTMNVFLERSIPTQGVFCVDREVGMAFYNQSRNQRWTWSSGVFFDSISESLKERQDDNQGLRLAGRLTFLPYYDEPSNGRYMIHTGVGVLHTNDHDNRYRIRARPQIREGVRIIDSGFLDADQYTTGNMELAIVYGRTTVQSEAYVSSIDMLNGDNPTVGGAYVHTSIFLTGENRIYERFGQHGAQFGRTQPHSNAFWVPGAMSLGALEFKARWSYLDINQVNGGQYNDVTVGMNWYWSDRTRVMLDWIHPMLSEDSVYGPVDADIIGTRFDFNW